MGNDPPGQFTRALHPRVGRHGDPPANVIPIGRSVIVPANGSLPNIILSPRAIFRIKRVLEQERFDVLHLHEPMTPVTCISVLALATAPIVATHHASGDLGWMKPGDARPGASSRAASTSGSPSPSARATRRRAGCPATTRSSRTACSSPTTSTRRAASTRSPSPAGRRRARGSRCCCAPGPRSTGGRAPGSRSAAPTRSPSGCSSPGCGSRTTGIDILGFLPQEELTSLLARTKALIAPSLGGESFGMVLTRAFACALPVVASDIPGYREVTTPETLRHRAAGRARRRSSRRSRRSSPTSRAAWRWARRRAALAVERYAWSDIARRLEGIYERAIEADARRAA